MTTEEKQLLLKLQFSRKFIKLIVSVLIFSLLLSPKFCLSRFTLQLLTHTIDKNYMFLFCNGLLVIVAKYSSLITSFSSSSHPSSKPTDQNQNNYSKTMDYEYFENYKAISEFQSVPKQYQLLQEPSLAEEVTETIDVSSHDVGSFEEPAKDIYMVQEYQETQRGGGEEEEEENQAEKHVEVQEKGGGGEEQMLSPHEKENGYGLDGEFEQTNETEDEEEEEQIGGMTTEEMNKKFDEFIRKMKEELRIEAQRQLIVV